MKKVIFSGVLIFIGLFVFANIHQKDKDETKIKLENLSGKYSDSKPIDWGRGTYSKREFTFKDQQWSLTFTLGLDPELKHQVFQFRTYGKYTVQQPSKEVKNAYEAIFTEEKKFVTLKTDDPRLIKGFGFTACDLTLNKEKDISITGCALWRSVSECSEDHDLLSLDAKGNLYFGVRPSDNDMCTADKRPHQLTPPVTKK